MKIVDVEQRSDEWYAFRKEGIGASEASAVLGTSRYKTPKDIWEIKTERAFPDFTNVDMQRGIDLEPSARAAFEMIIGKSFPSLCGIHDELPYIRASFDGVSKDFKEIAEFKCPRTMKLFKILKEENLPLFMEEYPEYYAQIMHQFAVCDTADTAYIVSYINGEIAYMRLSRDAHFIETLLIPEITSFWKEFVLKDVEPPLSGKDCLYIDDPEAIKEAEELVALSETIKNLLEKEKSLKKRIADRSDDGNFQVGPILRVTRVNKKGNVDTKKLYEAYAITENDLKKFRKSGIGFWQYRAL